MKYGLNLLLWTSDPTDEYFPLLERIRGWGYDGVELPVFDHDVPKYAAAGAECDGLGLGRTAVTVCPEEADPIHEDAAVRRAAVDHLKGVLDGCAAAGAETLCGPLHSALGVFRGRGRTDAEWGRAKDVLREVGDHAADAGVMLALEPLNRFECYFLNTAAETARFCEELGHPSVKMMYDTFHAHIEEKDAAAAVRACSGELVHVHVSENDRGTPGEGQVNWEKNFHALSEAGYDGWMVIEAFGLALPALAAATKIWRRMFPDEGHLAVHGLEFMKSRVAAAGEGVHG